MIDFHTHPLLVREMHKKHPELARIAREVFHIGNNPQPLETFLLEMDVSGIERAALLPIDATTAKGCAIYTNEQIAELCAMSDRFIGFASVDPHKKTAVRDLERAVSDLGLKGLKLSGPTQEFFPDDKKIAYPIYKKALELRIPVIFHAGMSWEPNAKLKYSQPMLIEDVAFDFPELNIIIAHMGWPWVLNSVALALKYPNVYLDTSCLYFDNPDDFISFTMTKLAPLSVFEKSLRNKIIFGSNYPRVEIKNMVRAVKNVGLTDGCLDLVFSGNAKRLLGEEK